MFIIKLIYFSKICTEANVTYIEHVLKYQTAKFFAHLSNRICWCRTFEHEKKQKLNFFKH